MRLLWTLFAVDLLILMCVSFSVSRAAHCGCAGDSGPKNRQAQAAFAGVLNSDIEIVVLRFV